MNEEFILQLIKNHTKDNKLTYKSFDEIFHMLSHKEQYEVCNILDRNGIELVDYSEEQEEIIIDDELILTDLVDSEEIFENNNDLFLDKSTYKSSQNITLLKRDKIEESNEVLCILIQQGNEQAKQDLCVKNMGLVAEYVKRYSGYFGSHMSKEDLIQEGYIGLLKAANRFDKSMGNAFTTYAVWWIQQSISRAIMDSGFMIRMPVHMFERIGKVTKLDREYEDLGIEYDNRMNKISEELGIKIEYVKQCIEYRSVYLNCTSLDIPIGEEGNSHLMDFLEDRNELSPDEYFYKQLLKEEIDEVLQGLNEREEKVLRLRFGLLDGRARTLEEVGKEFNVTRERIRQIEAKALRKLKHPNRSMRLEAFMEGINNGK